MRIAACEHPLSTSSSFQGGTRDVVAVKCVLKSSLNKASTENLLTEIELLKSMHHDHIVQLKDFQVVQLLMYNFLEDEKNGTIERPCD